MSFLEKIKGTKISAQELYETFKLLQHFEADDLIAFWQTIQFAVEVDEKSLTEDDQKKIGNIERVVVDNMINLVKTNEDLRWRFIEIVHKRDKKRDPLGLFKLFPKSDFEKALAPSFLAKKE